MLCLLLLLVAPCAADLADYGRVPHGSNPILYDPLVDPIIQLDNVSFDETVLASDAAFTIEFYADWCGHCRAFAPFYKAFADDVRRWSPIVKVAAINCADPFNDDICRANEVYYFPFMKYFRPNSRNISDGVVIRALHSLGEMRDQLTDVLLEDYDTKKYPDWPNFEYLGDISTYGELWAGTAESANHLAVVFERSNDSYVGAQLLLDLNKQRLRLGARRCLETHPLVTALRIFDFPTIVMFKRNERLPVYISELRRILLADLERLIGEDDKDDLHFTTSPSITSSTIAPLSCERQPEKCKELFYLSETDMLKALRYALYREVPFAGNVLSGAKLTALSDFVLLLANHFPRQLSNEQQLVQIIGDGTQSNSSRAEQASAVFNDLSDWLHAKGPDARVTANEWQHEFVAAEKRHGAPFPVNAKWQHCRGTSEKFRGFTCGLWTSFHALTVRVYLDNVADNNFTALPILQTIRNWVDHFFSCRTCRDHFIQLTTKIYSMENKAKHPHDVFMYMWKVHNIVNARLKGRDTEDPQFPKYQFPAPFLCPQCSKNGVFDEAQVRSFLVRHYSDIKRRDVITQETLKFL